MYGVDATNHNCIQPTTFKATQTKHCHTTVTFDLIKHDLSLHAAVIMVSSWRCISRLSCFLKHPGSASRCNSASPLQLLLWTTPRRA